MIFLKLKAGVICWCFFFELFFIIIYPFKFYRDLTSTFWEIPNNEQTQLLCYFTVCFIYKINNYLWTNIADKISWVSGSKIATAPLLLPHNKPAGYQLTELSSHFLFSNSTITGFGAESNKERFYVIKLSHTIFMNIFLALLKVLARISLIKYRNKITYFFLNKLHK